MRTKRIEIVEKEITTYKCDYCEESTENNSGCCGHQPIMRCAFCKADACRKHLMCYNENGGDYCDLHVCNTCMPKADRCWAIANEIAGRHDDFIDVVMKVFNNFSEYEHHEGKPILRDVSDLPSFDTINMSDYYVK